MGPWSANCIGALVLASRWTLLILGSRVNAQGSIDLVGKTVSDNNLATYGLLAFKHCRCIGLVKKLTPIDYGISGQGDIDLVGRN
jgi:hypothetical protein